MNQKPFKLVSPARIINLTFCLILIVLTQLTAFVSAAETKIEIEYLRAVSAGQNGVFVEWRSSLEIGNLGYNIYRLEAGEQIQINQALVPGSVFLAGAKDQPLIHKSYSFFDPNGSPESEYVIEAVTADYQRRVLKVKTIYDSKVFARLESETKNRENTAVAKIGPNIFGQREHPAAIQTTEGLLSSQPQIVPDPDRQRWVAAQPGLKFATKTNGLYRVSRQQLADAGFDVSVPTVNWQLYADGVEQTMLLTGDNNGGILGADGYLEFYGFGVDNLYTDAQIFYLVVGTEAGKRMQIGSTRGKKTNVVTQSFESVAQCRTSVVANCNKPTVFTTEIINGAAENFFGDVIFNAPVNLTINTPAVNPNAAEAIIEIAIQGFSVNPPTHNFEVSLNGTVVGTFSGAGRSAMRKSFNVSASLLQPETNVVRITSTINNSVTLLESVRIRYARRYVAADNKLLFTTGYYRAARIEMFTDNTARVFDVSDQNNVKIVNSAVVNDGAAFTVSVPAGLPRLMYAVADAAVLAPAGIIQNVPSNLYQTTQNKDLIILTHKNWQTEANALATYRQNQGLDAIVVDVEDVFDEFSFGAGSPVGVRAFFERALPQYALLFGDATHDPRNYLSSTVNYVPTILIDSNYGEIASDEIMGDFTVAPGEQACARSFGGDCVADFPIGRLSARSAAQAQTLVSKIIGFEQTVEAGETFSRGALFISDYVNGYNFAATNQALSLKLPANTPKQFTNAVANPSGAQLTQTREEIVARINQGPFIVGYAGHGSNTGWSFPDIFPAANVSSVTNADRLSIFLMLTCLNGAFADYRSDPSIAENLMRNPNGGAAAVWASSGLTVAPGQDVMAHHFYDAHREASVGVRIGNLTRAAKLETNDNDVRASWVLFGDPTLKIK